MQAKPNRTGSRLPEKTRINLITSGRQKAFCAKTKGWTLASDSENARIVERIFFSTQARRSERLLAKNPYRQLCFLPVRPRPPAFIVPLPALQCRIGHGVPGIVNANKQQYQRDTGDHEQCLGGMRV